MINDDYEQTLSIQRQIVRDEQPGLSPEDVDGEARRQLRAFRAGGRHYSLADARDRRDALVNAHRAAEEKAAKVRLDARREQLAVAEYERELASAKEALAAADDEHARHALRTNALARASRSADQQFTAEREREQTALTRVREARPWLFGDDRAKPKHARAASKRMPQPLELERACVVAARIFEGAGQRAAQRSNGATTTSLDVELELDAVHEVLERKIPIRSHDLHGRKLAAPIKWTARVAKLVASVSAPALREGLLGVMLSHSLGEGGAEYRELAALAAGLQLLSPKGAKGAR